MSTSYYHDYIDRLFKAMSDLPAAAVEDAFRLICAAREEQKTVYVIGNGGSASTASHMACDLGKGASVDGKRRLRVVSLNDNMAHFSALANDFSYDDVFIEQLKNLLQPRDVVIAISASGNSPNVVKAFEYARATGASTIGLVGFRGGRLKPLSDVAIHVQSDAYGPVEDAHLIINHIWTERLRAHVEAEA